MDRSGYTNIFIWALATSLRFKTFNLLNGPSGPLENCEELKSQHRIVIFPSRVSGRGYKIGAVCPSVCLCVCVSVIQLSHGWTVWRMDLKICVKINIDNILDEFEHQGHRSKVKVTVLKNVIFSCCNVWNVCVRTSMGQEYWQGYVAGGRVNAQAFSCYNLTLNTFCYFSHNSRWI